MDIFEEGLRRAKSKAAMEAAAPRVPPMLSEAQHIIGRINAQLPELFRRLTAARVAPSTTIAEPSYIQRRWFGSTVVLGAPLFQGWPICTVTHREAGQVGYMSSSEGSTVSASLVLIEDGRVVETSGSSFRHFYEPDGDLPPTFIYPNIDSSLRYSYDLQRAAEGLGLRSPESYALAFARHYQRDIVEFVSKHLGSR